MDPGTECFNFVLQLNGQFILTIISVSLSTNISTFSGTDFEKKEQDTVDSCCVDSLHNLLQLWQFLPSDDNFAIWN